MEIYSNVIYILNPAYSLVKNGSLRILIDLNDISKYTILNEIACVIVTLLKPDRPLCEVINKYCYLYDLDYDSAFVIISKSISSINKSSDFIIMYEQGMNAKTYDPVDFYSSSPDVSDTVRLEVPLELGITLTHKCNTDCKYCYAERKHIKSEDLLSPDDWLSIIREAKGLGVLSIPLLGGDVLTYSHIFKVLKSLREYNYKIEISTKCYISEIFAHKLSSYVDKDSFIQLSIDSSKREVADFLVGKDGFLDRMIETMRNLTKYGINIRVKSVMTNFNIKGVEELILMLHDHGVKQILIEDYGRSYYRHSDDLFVDPDLSIWAKDRVAYIKDKHPDINVMYGAQSYDRHMKEHTSSAGDELWNKWKKRNKCSAGSSSITISPSGMVIPCEQMPQNPTHSLGNIKNKSIIEIWNSQELLNYVYPHKGLFIGKPCYECLEFDNCHRRHGHCFRNALFSYNDHLMPSPDCPEAPKPKIRLV